MNAVACVYPSPRPLSGQFPLWRSWFRRGAFEAMIYDRPAWPAGVSRPSELPTSRVARYLLGRLLSQLHHARSRGSSGLESQSGHSSPCCPSSMWSSAVQTSSLSSLTHYAPRYRLCVAATERSDQTPASPLAMNMLLPAANLSSHSLLRPI